MKRTLALRAAAIAVIVAGLTVVNILVLSPRLNKRVSVEVAALKPLPLIVRAAGTLEAKASVSLHIPYDSSVVEKHFKEGDRVVANQVLLVVDREKIRLDYQNAKDTFANARADVLRARKDLRLQKTLFGQQAVAQTAVEEAQRALTRAEQALRVAQEAFRLADVRWNANVLRAPFAGTVVRDALGDSRDVAAGKDLLTIADVSEYTVQVTVDELDIKQIVAGQTADVKISIYPQTKFKAKVLRIGTAAENAGQGVPAIPIVLRLLSTEGLLLRPKLSAEVRIRTGETEPVFSVPREAIDNTQGVPRVWRLGRFERLQPMAVTLGRANPERLEISKGLQAGWVVCVKANPEFAPGMRVIRSLE